MPETTLLDNTLGVRTEYSENQGAGEYHLRTVQDVEPILDYTRRLRTAGRRYESPSRSFRHVATVPIVVMEIWQKEDPDIIKDRRKFRAKLNSPEWKYLKVSDTKPIFPTWAKRECDIETVKKVEKARQETIGEINQAVAGAGLTPIRV